MMVTKLCGMIFLAPLQSDRAHGHDASSKGHAVPCYPPLMEGGPGIGGAVSEEDKISPRFPLMMGGTMIVVSLARCPASAVDANSAVQQETKNLPHWRSQSPELPLKIWPSRRYSSTFVSVVVRSRRHWVWQHPSVFFEGT